MTATQVFLMFLKKNCILDEYLFFRNIIMNDNGNKYFRKRKLYKNTFVEDYLSRNNRALNNFMTRLFILAPNLKHKLHRNPRFFIIRDTWIKEHGNKPYEIKVKNSKGEVLFARPRIIKWNEYKGVGMYVVYYRRLWNKFLKEYIDDSEKKINSPFKKGECYNFKLKKTALYDTCD
jgi:hypothetical protein